MITLHLLKFYLFRIKKVNLFTICVCILWYKTVQFVWQSKELGKGGYKTALLCSLDELNHFEILRNPDKHEIYP